MNICPKKSNSECHSFIERPVQRKQPARVKTVCAFCGQVRQIWESGAVEILRFSGEVTIQAQAAGYEGTAP